ncbi:hypothetical protein PENTCL1PPCAC_5253, partial [Pristionchus entomophagus]
VYRGFVTIEVELRVTRARGISLPPTFDFSNANENNDVHFLVKGKHIHVNKQPISIFAPELGKVFGSGETEAEI